MGAKHHRVIKIMNQSLRWEKLQLISWTEAFILGGPNHFWNWLQSSQKVGQISEGNYVGRSFRSSVQIFLCEVRKEERDGRGTLWTRECERELPSTASCEVGNFLSWLIQNCKRSSAMSVSSPRSFALLHKYVSQAYKNRRITHPRGCSTKRIIQIFCTISSYLYALGSS